MHMSKKIESLLKKYMIKLSTDLDQHFFKDKNMLLKIVSSARIKKTETIVEIGSGLGFLTKELAKRSGRVIAIEKDPQFFEILHDELAGFKNVEIIIGNALTALPDRFDKIVSNMPYNLCEPLLQKIHNYDFKLAVLLVPKKFAHRMIGTGNIARLCGNWKVELLDDVPLEVFYPRPRIISKIVRISKNKPKELK